MQRSQLEKESSAMAMRPPLRAFVPLLAVVAAAAVHVLLPNTERVGTETLAYMCVLGALGAAAVVAIVVSCFSRRFRAWFSYNSWLLGAMVLTVALWDLLTTKMIVFSEKFSPGPDAIFGAFAANTGQLFSSFLSSCWLLLIGFVLGFVLGMVSAAIMGWFKGGYYWLSPVMWVTASTPGAVLLPIFVTVFPSNYSAGAALVTLSMWFSITYNVGEAIREIDLHMIESAQILGASSLSMLFRVIVPSMMPAIFSGLFMGFCFCFASVLTAEMITASSGLGGYIIWAKSAMDYEKVYAGMLLIAIFFFVILDILGRVERYALRWQQDVVREV